MVQTNKIGSNVQVFGMTPLEAVLLTNEHHRNVGKAPVTLVGDVTEVERDDLEEVDRLKSKYGNGKVDACLRATMNRLPEDFSTVEKIGLKMSPFTKGMAAEVADFKL